MFSVLVLNTEGQGKTVILSGLICSLSNSGAMLLVGTWSRPSIDCVGII